MPEGVQLFAAPRSRGRAWEGVAKERWRMGPVPALSHSSFVHGPSPLPEWEDWGPGPYHRHHWIPVLTQCTHVAGLLDSLWHFYIRFKEGARIPITVTLPPLLNSFRPGKRMVWAKVTWEGQAICQPVKHSRWLACLSQLPRLLSRALAQVTGLGSPKPLCALHLLLPSEPRVPSCPPCLRLPSAPLLLLPSPGPPHPFSPSLSSLVSLLSFSFLPQAGRRL